MLIALCMSLLQREFSLDNVVVTIQYNKDQSSLSPRLYLFEDIPSLSQKMRA